MLNTKALTLLDNTNSCAPKMKSPEKSRRKFTFWIVFPDKSKHYFILAFFLYPSKPENVFILLLSFIEKCELFYKDRGSTINNSTFMSCGLHMIHFPFSRWKELKGKSDSRGISKLLLTFLKRGGLHRERVTFDEIMSAWLSSFTSSL